MSARESNLRQACGRGPGSGKCTRDGSQPPTGDATQPTPVYPHLPYGDTVHAELVDAGLKPDLLETGLRRVTAGGQELFLRLVWLPDNPRLSSALQHGLTLLWQPVIGWGARDADDVELLDVDELAAPELLADTVRHLVEHGLGRAWVPPADGRWEHADDLDTALDRFAEQEVTR